jgi:hypothetical protein
MKFLKVKMIALVLMLLGVGQAWAQEFDEEPPTRSKASVDRAQPRAYPGGRDEQELDVQPSLPQPTRSLDATASPTGEGGQEPSVD